MQEIIWDTSKLIGRSYEMGEIRLSRHEKAHITVWTEGRARLIHAKEGWRFKCALGREGQMIKWMIRVS